MEGVESDRHSSLCMTVSSIFSTLFYALTDPGVLNSVRYSTAIPVLRLADLISLGEIKIIIPRETFLPQ